MTKISLAMTGAVVLLLASLALHAQAPKTGVARPLSDVKFAQDDDRKCLAGAIENGDPATGPSTFILKAPPGCEVPWHYHTAEEQLIVTAGLVSAQMGSMEPSTLGPGGFAMMPGKEKHRFACKSDTPCIMFVTFDKPYDIVWVKEDSSPQ